MQILPDALQKTIEALAQLPGVGPRTAERYAYYLLKTDARRPQEIAHAVSQLQDNVTLCKKTFALIDADQEYSELYTHASRNKQLVAVVADPFDILALEKTSLYQGTYHVLGGLISPIDGVGPEQLHINELLQRINDDEVIEIILATNASVEGESTALYLQKKLEGSNVKITRLARGLPIGVDLEYADQITLSRALEGRTTL
jgi:recombination protein RecR